MPAQVWTSWPGGIGWPTPISMGGKRRKATRKASKKSRKTTRKSARKLTQRRRR